MKDNDLFNKVVSLDEAHNSIVESAKLYMKFRLELGERLPTPSALMGPLITGMATEEQMLALGPYIINVESLIVPLRTHAAEATKQIGETLDGVTSLLRKQLGIPFRFERKPAVI